MGLVVTAIEADLAIDPESPTNLANRSTIWIMSSDMSMYVSWERRNGAGVDQWQWQEKDTALTGGDIAGADGEGRIELSISGADVLCEMFIDGVSKRTGTLTGGAEKTWNVVSITITRLGSTSSDTARNLRTAVTALGDTQGWTWDSSAELDEWDPYYPVPSVPKPVLTGGYLAPEPTTKTGYASRVYTAPSLSLSATLAPPGVYRRAVATAAKLQTYYVADAADIITGQGDADPELLWTGASGTPLTLITARSPDICVALGSGVEASGGWGAMSTVRAGREYPCACVLEPSHDVYCIAVDTTNHVAYGQRLAWGGSSYTVGTEQIVTSGDAASQRGAVVFDIATGKLLYTYPDTGGAVQLLTSADQGASWA